MSTLPPRTVGLHSNSNSSSQADPSDDIAALPSEPEQNPEVTPMNSVMRTPSLSRQNSGKKTAGQALEPAASVFRIPSALLTPDSANACTLYRSRSAAPSPHPLQNFVSTPTTSAPQRQRCPLRAPPPTPARGSYLSYTLNPKHTPLALCTQSHLRSASMDDSPRNAKQRATEQNPRIANLGFEPLALQLHTPANSKEREVLRDVSNEHKVLITLELENDGENEENKQKEKPVQVEDDGEQIAGGRRSRRNSE